MKVVRISSRLAVGGAAAPCQIRQRTLVAVEAMVSEHAAAQANEPQAAAVGAEELVLAATTAAPPPPRVPTFGSRFLQPLELP